jgi:ribonuclease BN (tRNA processing enzyme)
LLPLAEGECVAIGARRIAALPARHAIPAVGYALDGGAGVFVFSGDSTYCEAFWDAVNRIERLHTLMIETTFLNRAHDAAERGGHTTAELLAQGLARLARPARLLITHMEPPRRIETFAEVMAAAAAWQPREAREGEILEL